MELTSCYLPGRLFLTLAFGDLPLTDFISPDMIQNPFSLRRTLLIIVLSFMSCSIMAQKTNLDSLNFKQLNKYIVKAGKMKNTGMILTFSGVGIVAAGYITSVIWSNTDSLEGWEVFKTLIPFEIGVVVGIPISIVGISLWAVGGSRKTKADIAIQKIRMVPKNSMALGVGITLSF